MQDGSFWSISCQLHINFTLHFSSSVLPLHAVRQTCPEDNHTALRRQGCTFSERYLTLLQSYEICGPLSSETDAQMDRILPRVSAATLKLETLAELSAQQTN